MDYALQMLLNNINQEVICVIEGTEKEFQNGKLAIDELRKGGKRYAFMDIAARNNVIVLTIKDVTEEIQSKNEEFIADYKRRFGYEPSFF